MLSASTSGRSAKPARSDSYSRVRDGAGVLDRLLSDPALRAGIGDAGRRTVLERYSLEVVSRRLVSMLEGLFSQSSSS